MKTRADSLNVAKSQALNKVVESLSKLRKTWQWLLQVFAGSSELQLWQTRDRDGYQWWHMYDRATNRYFVADSETELRRLIEQRYSRR